MCHSTSVRSIACAQFAFFDAENTGMFTDQFTLESLRVVDIKIQISPIGQQTVITHDNVNVEIDSVIYFLVQILFYFFIHYV